MSLIDRAATFRGNIVDHAVGVTRNEFPQFVCSLIAKQIYDEEEQVWVDWTDVDQNEITAYVVLYGSKGETLSFNQVKKVFNWDGASFADLNNGDYSEVGIQFRTIFGKGEYASKLKVDWIDEYDAVPGRSVRKLDPDELKQLDAKYAQFLKGSGKKAAPAKAPTTKVGGGKAGTVKAKGAAPTSPKGPVKKTTKKSTLPKLPATQTATEATAPPVPDGLPTGHCTKQEAWDAVVDMKDKQYTDAQLGDYWLGAIKEIGEGEPTKELVESLTDEQWFLVKEKVLGETAVF